MTAGTLVRSPLLGHGIVVNIVKSDECVPVGGWGCNGVQPGDDHGGTYKSCRGRKEQGLPCDCVLGRFDVLFPETEGRMYTKVQFHFPVGDAFPKTVEKGYPVAEVGDLEVVRHIGDVTLKRVGRVGDPDHPVREGSIFSGWDCYGDAISVDCCTENCPDEDPENYHEGLEQNADWYAARAVEETEEDPYELWDDTDEDDLEMETFCIGCIVREETS